MADLQDFAGVVALAIKAAMAPVLERVALMEAQVKAMSSVDQSVTELRERLVVAETKAAFVVPPSLPEGFIDRLTALEQRPVSAPVVMADDGLRDRVIAIETKAAGFETRLAAPQLVATHVELYRRLDVLEQRPVHEPVDLTGVRDRLAAIETKAAELVGRVPSPEFIITPSQFAAAVDKTERITADLAKDVGALRERVAVVEVRQPVPGPPGPAGTNGTNGTDGKDGSDGLGFDEMTVDQDSDRAFTIKAVRGDRVKTLGTATFPVLIHRDVWLDGKSYERGDMVTWAGSSWHCNEPTSSKPGESKAWTLTVKRGRDGKDGKDAQVLPVVKVGA